MAEVQKQDRLVRESFVTTILGRLRDWLPFKKYTEKVEFVVGEDVKPVLSINYKGEIFYLDGNNISEESLQTKLNKIGLTIITDETGFNDICTKSNLGKYIYLEKSGEIYSSGLYNIILNANNHGNIEPKLLSQNIKNELSNYYDKEAIDKYFKNYISRSEIGTIVTEKNVEDIIVQKLKEIIETDESGNISIKLEGYVTIDDFNKRIDIIENWMGINPGKESGAISTEDLEEITQKDINNDKTIGYNKINI